MSQHATSDIRNIALIGGPGTGKTTFVEAILHATGVIGRMGNISDGNTVSDFGADERDKKHSLQSSFMYTDHKGCHYNLLDAPGYPDFVGEATCALAGAETALLFVNPEPGVTFPSHKVWDLAGDLGRARGVVITHIDAVEFDPDAFVAKMSEELGVRCVPLNLPQGTGAALEGVKKIPLGETNELQEQRQALLEAIVEVDEEAMTRFLEEDILPAEEQVHALMTQSIIAGEMVPVFFVSSTTGHGVKEFLDSAAIALPSPLDGPFYKDTEGRDIDPTRADPEALVINVVIDPFVGKLSMLRIISGNLSAGAVLHLMRTGKNEKLAHLQVMQGKDHKEVHDALAGDIIAVAKLDDLEISDTIAAGNERTVEPLKMPKPMAARAIEPANHADELKLAEAIRRAASEDPAFSIERDEFTAELIVHGTSIMHIETLLRRITARSGVEINVKVPRVALKETVTGNSPGHHRHKKQTGGRGQFAEVSLVVEAAQRGEGLQFLDETVGGSVPKQFIPAIEKGVREAMGQGIIAGYRVEDVTVRVKDGKFHDVDSDEASFKLAGQRAFKDGFAKARPVLLEPMLDVEVAVPSRFMGAITSDMTGRRGQITGMDSKGDIQVIRATVPQRELLTYPTVLHSLTSGEGSYSAAFHDYEVVPSNIQQELMAEYTPEHED